MITTFEEYVNRIAGVTLATKEAMERSLFQRRNQVTDINGIYFYAQGGEGVPAETRIGISKDMVYLQRFEFKLVISPFQGTGGLTPDIRPVPVEATRFRVLIDGVDVSPYLAAHHDGWVRGAGMWPSEDIDDNYDLLQVMCDMWSQAQNGDAAALAAYKKLSTPGNKKFQVTGNGLFSMSIQLWCKFPSSNR